MIRLPGAYSSVNLAIDATAILGSVTALANTGQSVSLVGGAVKGRVRLRTFAATVTIETVGARKEDPAPTRGRVSSLLDALALARLLFLGVYHNRATANCRSGIGIVSTINLIVVYDHVAVVPVPDLDAEQIDVR